MRVTPCKFVDSADSFYSANIMLFGKYYARSDILCSPSENCTSLMTMTLTSLLIRPIRSIRRTDTFIHDVTSSFHPTIASYYSDGDRFYFRRNKHICSENKHRGQTQGNVQVNTSFFKREPQGKYESTLIFTKGIRLTQKNFAG